MPYCVKELLRGWVPAKACCSWVFLILETFDGPPISINQWIPQNPIAKTVFNLAAFKMLLASWKKNNLEPSLTYIHSITFTRVRLMSARRVICWSLRGHSSCYLDSRVISRGYIDDVKMFEERSINVNPLMSHLKSSWTPRSYRDKVLPGHDVPNHHVESMWSKYIVLRYLKSLKRTVKPENENLGWGGPWCKAIMGSAQQSAAQSALGKMTHHIRSQSAHLWVFTVTFQRSMPACTILEAKI